MGNVPLTFSLCLATSLPQLLPVLSSAQERARLERLVRLTTRGDHAAAFREYVAEMEAHLERCMQVRGAEAVHGCGWQVEDVKP